MAERVAPVLYYGGIHLLYASMVWMAAWAITSIPRGSATAKYWIWLAASLNFVLPLGAVLDRLFGPRLSFATPLTFIGGIGLEIAENHKLALTLATIWLCGAGGMAFRLCLRLRSEARDPQHAAQEAKRSFFAHGIAVTFGGSQAPVVEGILRPRISLPSGIDKVLSADELDAVLLHELTHAKRRDNLTRLVHEMVLCALWFHPMVWVSNARIGLYRELSCDESVIQEAHGADLVSALAKLATAERPVLLQAMASSFMSVRLVRLIDGRPGRPWGPASAALSALFGVALTGGVFSTVAHTACCFRVHP